MGDISNPRLLVVKALLFLLLGCVAATLILLRTPELRVAALLTVAIWAFCRAYYFAFYVIEHYIDGEYRFAGLGSAAKYLWRARRRVEGAAFEFEGDGRER